MSSFDDLPDPEEERHLRLARLVLDSLGSESMREVEAPHVVVCTDTESGTASYQGPYRDGMAALAAAEAEAGDLGTTYSGLRFSVAPLLSPREDEG